MAGRVLVVDDNVVFARALVRALEGHGFAVRWLTHGGRLAASLAEGELDAAVVEAVMPGLSGLRVLDQLAASSPGTKVLMLAASPQLDTAVEAMKKGAVDYLVKPQSPEAVAQAVRNLVPAPPA